MKNKIIRQSVFETNSSSTHSLSISNGSEPFVYDSVFPDSDGIVRISSGEFGWEFEKYNDAHTKMSYCYIYARDWTKENSGIFLNILRSVVLNQTGANDVRFEDDESHFLNGYIDHQSVESNDLDYLFEDEEQLRRFIFDKNSWLYLGNDNDYTPDGFYNTSD